MRVGHLNEEESPDIKLIPRIESYILEPVYEVNYVIWLDMNITLATS